ncbi:transcription termination factor 1-like isoform X2 [Salvelinus fontinalis]|nr:transcription termination factor 1-like isoform X2 [Salvelinus fontinalis]XP_055783868.1 transcription termination factor 1-like isoform X2 [Salvelinus fontinalis]
MLGTTTGRKQKKEIVGEIQLNICPDETKLPGILEKTGRKWKTTSRLKTQPDGGAVEGSRRKRQPDGGAVEGSRRKRQPDGGAVEGSRRKRQPDGGAVEGSRRKRQPDGGAVEGSRRKRQPDRGAVEGSRRKRQPDGGAVEGSRRKRQPDRGAVEGSRRKRQPDGGAVEGSRRKRQPDRGAVEGSRRRKRQPDGGAVEGSRRRKRQPDRGAVEGSRRKRQPDGGAVEGSRRKRQPDGGAVEGSRRRKRQPDRGAVEGSRRKRQPDGGAVEGSRRKRQPDGGAVEGSRRKRQPDGGAVEGSRRKRQPDGGAVEGSRRKRQPDGGAVEGSRRKRQPDGGAVEGSRRKRQRCRESDTGMDSVPSKSNNRTPDAAPESETGEDGPHTTTVETSTQHRRRIQNDKALSENEWRAMIELQEFVPNVASRPVNKIRAMIKYDLYRFKEFRRQGISLRTGRYSAQENKQLMSNIKDFLALTGIENAAKLFHTKRFKDELTQIQRLKSHHRFPERIAEGIPRPWHKVYSRGGRKMFDGSSYKGRRRFSEDELYSLKKLQTLHGNNWVKISQLTGRSETPLRKRFSQMFANLGSWSEEELKRLMEAVRDHLLGQVEPGRGHATIRKDKLYNNIPWTDVCRRVRTRHRDQCRMKWLGVMAHKMTYGQPVFSGGVKTVKAKVDLIKALNAMQVEDATDIDWEEIAHTIGGVTPCYVQMHYHKLKVAKVPLRQSMSFCGRYKLKVAKVPLRQSMSFCGRYKLKVSKVPLRQSMSFCGRYKLKVAKVPLRQSMSFCEIIDFLYSSVLPKFEELLRHSQTESGETESRDLHQVQTESGETESRDLHQVQTESGETESRDLHQVQTESGETESRDDPQDLFLLSEIFENEDD